MESKNFAYCLTDWEGEFAENPKDRMDFYCTEKVFESYEDARKDAEERLIDRISVLQEQDKDYTLQVYCDMALETASMVAPNEQCYLKKLFDENNEELCTLRIVKYQYERKQNPVIVG